MPLETVNVAPARGWFGSMADGLRRVWQFFGVDEAIAFSILNTARSVVGGPLIALLITLHFTAVMQGYYYTFSSVVALQVFAELGLSAVLVQFAAHEWTGLSYDGRTISGDPDRLSRLADIMRLALRWYGVAALATTMGLGLGGYWFFPRQDHPEVEWARPWFCLAGFTGLKLLLTPLFSILEGGGQLKQVYGYRLVEGLLTLAVAVAAISGGVGLWTAVAVTGATLVANLVFLLVRYGPFFRALRSAKVTARLSWREEMLPMQWRIAVSWICGYFLFQLFTPVLFNYHGPIVAGQFGLTWSVVSVVSGISIAWINTKVPKFGALIAQKQFHELDRLALRAGLGATFVAVLGAVATLAVLMGLQRWYPEIGHRFLPIAPSAVFLAAVVLNQLSFTQSAYLRAHKREPFLWLSVGAAAVGGLGTWYFGSRYGALEMAWAYLGVIGLFGLPVGTIIFLRCRRAWHAPQPA